MLIVKMNMSTKIILDNASTCIITEKGELWYSGYNNTSFKRVDLGNLTAIKYATFARYDILLLIDGDNKLWSLEGGKLFLWLEGVLDVKILYGVVHVVLEDGSVHYATVTSNFLGSPSFVKIFTGEAKEIMVSNSTIVVLDRSGHVWVMGTNTFGEFGFGHTKPISEFKCTNLVNIISVSANRGYIIALDVEGKLWAAGTNRKNVLGLGDEKLLNSTFISIGPPGVKVTSVESNDYFTVLRDENDKYWVTGVRLNYLGLDESYRPDTFVPLAMEEVVALKAMRHFVVCVKSDHRIWVSGVDHGVGNLGLGGAIELYKLTPTDFYVNK